MTKPKIVEIMEEGMRAKENKLIQWDGFIDQSQIVFPKDQIQTNIMCPECGKPIYYDSTVVFPTYPCKYRYYCTCGWEGTSFRKWVEE